MTLPSNYTDGNNYSQKKPKSEKGLIGIVIFSWIIIIAASSYNSSVGFGFAILFGLILVGLGQYSNNGKLNILLVIAAFIGFCIPIGFIWHGHAVWMDNFHHRYADLDNRFLNSRYAGLDN